ncbi:ATP-dependent DNA helicase RecQ [Psychrobacillus sp. OK032]|uniref:RecQ family ATP-dependent DNA helicase n=1 Tax=Psychrobacillus sp. OK032 TaxID=1884358 RepID=UPI0008C6A1BE|nr:RecQ family ATP-dependent DNA helicase [Psychrobacillus sp. OK032]SES33999.1 ATP-dependent DNA helicase RecQ [Psychrobacillus sp. OK032]
MDKLTEVLTRKFGYDSFREGQKEIIEHVIAGQDVVAILPTGMGKSLLYQLPGYLMEGSVVIVSPLLSLMQDQVEQLKMLGEKRVVAINSFLSFEQKEMAFRNLSSYKFIFTSPEMLQNERFNHALSDIRIAYIVADEAHCISQWGFDFRPDYLRIAKWLQHYRQTNVLALTATATTNVVHDIKDTLLMREPYEYIHSLDRPTIAYEAIEVKNAQEKLAWILGRITSTSGPGILYTQSRKKTEMYAHELQKRGIRVAYYHAKMDQDDRILVQQQFQQGQLEWICATNAFGMGIHKDNIRQIIHDHIPTSIASYMQEVGRAARDGAQSIASLLFTATDVEQAFYVAMQDFPEEADIRLAYESNNIQLQLPETTARILDYWKEELTEQETTRLFQTIKQKKWTEIQGLYTMLQNGVCIREQLLHYFDEQLTNRPKHCCSKCSLPLQEILVDRKQLSEKSEEIDWKIKLDELLHS